MEFLYNLGSNILASLVLFILGFAISKIPMLVRNHQFKNFWGEEITDKNSKIVLGAYSLLRGPKNNLKPSVEKVFQSRENIKIRGPEHILSLGMVRGSSYIVQALAKYRTFPIDVITDKEAYNNLDNTIIALGGAKSNELSIIAINDENNKFVERDDNLSEEGDIPSKFCIIDNGKKFLFANSRNGTAKQEYGLVAKIKNSRFPKHHFFVCGGLSPWGTSGAAWFLANNWMELYKEFGKRDFAIVVKTYKGSDTSALRVRVSEEGTLID